MPALHRCKSCLRDLPLSAFSTSDGRWRSGKCRECKNAAQREARKLRPISDDSPSRLCREKGCGRPVVREQRKCWLHRWLETRHPKRSVADDTLHDEAIKLMLR